MEISALTLKLIILLTPGALSAIIVKRLTVRHKQTTDFMFVLDAVLMGMFSYLILQVVVHVRAYIYNHWYKIPKQTHILQTFQNITVSNVIPYKEVIYASIIALVLGFLISFTIERKVVNEIAKKLHVSLKYGDLNLFSSYLSRKNIEWVYVRDVKNHLTYSGCISSYSETAEFKELVLHTVTVLNYPDSEEMYDVESVYLCFPKDEVIIEQALTQINNNDVKQEDNKQTIETSKDKRE